MSLRTYPPKARRQADANARAAQAWLQTQFAAILARHCISMFKALSANARKGFEREMRAQLAARTFERQLFIRNLWTSERSLTEVWTQAVPFGGGPRRPVRCALPFQELIDKEVPRTMFAPPDPVETLYRLFSACVPEARRIFTGPTGPLRLLHLNDYVMEKTFVYGIVALSKWLGQDRFPQGVFEWPPPLPADLAAPSHSSAPIFPDPGTSHLSGGSAASAHLGHGGASASSS